MSRALTCACLLLVVADTPAHAQGTAEQRAACTDDALKLCSDTIPDVTKTAACMKLHEAELTPRCRASLNETVPSKPAAAEASTSGQKTERTEERAAPPRRAARTARGFVDPDLEVPYTPPRRVIAPPVYTYPGPVIFPRRPLPDGSFCSPPYDFCEPDFLEDLW